MSIELAQAILKAAKLREESFDKQKAYEANNEAIDSGYGMVDMSQFYRLSIRQCADKANKELSTPVLLLLTGYWNESIKWAENYLKVKK